MVGLDFPMAAQENHVGELDRYMGGSLMPFLGLTKTVGGLDFPKRTMLGGWIAILEAHYCPFWASLKQWVGLDFPIAAPREPCWRVGLPYWRHGLFVGASLKQWVGWISPLQPQENHIGGLDCHTGLELMALFLWASLKQWVGWISQLQPPENHVGGLDCHTGLELMALLLGLTKTMGGLDCPIAAPREPCWRVGLPYWIGINGLFLGLTKVGLPHCSPKRTMWEGWIAILDWN